MKKRLIWLLTALLVTLAMTTGAQAEAGDSVYQAGEIETTDAELADGDPVFVITLADGGTMRGALYPDIAPVSVANFIALANSGFYDGLTFHRVIPGSLIQGGDPNGDGTGSPGWQIKGEFAANGWENSLKHTPGVLSMARYATPMDSAGSQFFIALRDMPDLDGGYAAFGLVTEGLEYAEAIASVPRDMETNLPDTPQVIQSIRVETFGVEYPHVTM